ncbi:MAG TPA: hypothetical protein VML96_03485 [Egibacteraceae bacterium]|nr:hypothetical protein [Egibacteraceae bacterium]
MRAGAVVALVAAFLAACDAEGPRGVLEGPPPRGGPPLVSATAEVDGDAPLAVSVAGVEPSSPDSPAVLRLTFETTVEGGVVIDDVRWTFAITQDPGLLAVAGAGCSPEFTAEDDVAFACTGEFRALEVHPDAPLVEEIRVHVPPEGFPVADGVFPLVQPIAWSLLDPTSPDEPVAGGSSVLLTVEVMAPGV